MDESPNPTGQTCTLSGFGGRFDGDGDYAELPRIGEFPELQVRNQ